MPNSNNIADVLATDFQQQQRQQRQRQGGNNKQQYTTPEPAVRFETVRASSPSSPLHLPRQHIAGDRDHGTAGIRGRRTATATATSTTTGTPTSRRSPAPLIGGNSNGNEASGISRTGGMPRKDTAENPLLTGDFWKSSFSSLSALASAALGSDTSSTDKQNRNMSRSAAYTAPSSMTTRGKSPRGGGRTSFLTAFSETPRARSSSSRIAASTSRRKPPAEWGPSGFVGSNNTTPTLKISGSNYKSSQECKREALLVQSASMNDEFKTDSRGNIKRRTSDDFPTLSLSPLPSSFSFSTMQQPSSSAIAAVRARPSSSAQMNSSSQDALVYIHHVQPTDTLTGVSIRYGCEMSVLRKCNGFWPSDSIQMRQVVVLPVEACTLRGRRVATEEKHVVGGDDEEQPFSGAGNGDDHNDATNRSCSPYLSSTAGLPRTGSDIGDGSKEKGRHSPEPTWKHEYYVQVEGNASLIEIGRVPRQSLGFFPRARRKSRSKPQSTTTSLLYPSNNDRQNSVIDDHTAAPFPFEPLQEESLAESRNSSTTRKPPPRRGGHHRQQSSLIFSGPGGVGSLESNGAAVPGPAEDQLNKFVKTHFPGLAKQFNDDNDPPAPTTTPSSSTAATAPATAGQSGLALEEVGSAIESWVKKMATKAKAGLGEAQMSLRQGASSSGGGGGGSAGGGSNIPPSSSDAFGIPSSSTRRGRSSRGSSAEPGRLGFQRGIFSFDGHGRGIGGGGDGEEVGEVIELSETPPVAATQRGRTRSSLHAGGEENVVRTASGVRGAGDGTIAPRRRGAPKKEFL